MTRRVENAVILTGRDAAMLWQAADLNDLRIRSRSNEALYALLHDIYASSLSWHVSVHGSKPLDRGDIRDDEGVEFYTVEDIAEKVGRTPRTVRNDISTGLLKATKNGHAWVVTKQAAEAYIAGRAEP